ncbi:MAG: succinate dehydrogenase/fumarate reductase iron-sulfur subunit, partial [Oscillatoriales cyanobacterium SM2_2_1]|nr:succinate dehydrogenase/fumarate reductase iron-sulfur subunit [Oscillatoriales cyanobacterium SM2_2_1]
APTPHRHRRSLIEFVAEDGWLDESKFGFQVVGDRGRDFKALWSLAPLGMRMIARGKMPYPWQFRRSPAHGEIKTLIRRVLQAPSPSPDSGTPSSAATPE